MSNGYYHALVTGASGGIGAALCRALDRAGVPEITLVARKRISLESIAADLKCKTNIVVADLTKPADLEAMLSDTAGVDLVINNAGIGDFGPFSEAPHDKIHGMMQLNCIAPVTIAAAIIPRMVEEGHGCVVNIASGMAFQPMPYMSTYAATKAFLLHWSEGISEEVRGSGVRVIAVCPGTVATGFAAAAGVPIDAIPGVSLVSHSMQAAVHAVLDAINKNTTVAVPGLGNRLGSIMAALSPRALVRRLLGIAMTRAFRA